MPPHDFEEMQPDLASVELDRKNDESDDVAMPDSQFQNVCLKLREDLRCSIHQYGDGTCYFIEDMMSARSYRFALREWSFISLLNGSMNMRDVLAAANENLQENALQENEASKLCRWLLKMRLVIPVGEDSARLSSSLTGEGPRRHRGRNSLLFFRIPLFKPDRFFERVTPYLKWLLSSRLVVIWFCLMISALFAISRNWNSLIDISGDIITQNGWLIIIIAWLFLKAIHEFAHALAAKKYGCIVKESGVILILFTPIAFVDISGIWRIRSKWRRIIISLAGVYVELAIAFIAAVVWSETSPGVLHHWCRYIVVTAGFATLMFNLNPLVRYDGYYVLSDLLNLPFLYQDGQAYIRYFGNRYILGVPKKIPKRVKGWQGVFIRCYGFASLFWRISFYIGITIAAGMLFHGLGILLAVFAVVTWGIVPAVRLIGFVLTSKNLQPLKRIEIGLRLACVGLIIYGLLQLPWPFEVHAPGVVRYDSDLVIHADTDGFVEKVAVNENDEVNVGQELVQLENHELMVELKELEIRNDISDIRGRIKYDEGDLTAYQIENGRQESYRKNIEELQQQVNNLVIRSKVKGRLVSSNPGELVGLYVESGTPLMTIASEDKKEIYVSVDQADLKQFLAHVGKEVHIRVFGVPGEEITGRLESCLPQASLFLDHPALGANYGGPLPVSFKAAYGDERQFRNQDRETGHLIEPRFDAVVSISPEDARLLYDGQLALIFLSAKHQSIGEKFSGMFYDWFRAKTNRRSAKADNLRSWP